MIPFNGLSLLLLVGAIGGIVALYENRKLRRALHEVCDTCLRCEGRGELSYYGSDLVDCPQCIAAREALNLPLHRTSLSKHPS